jgi:hypothetical protein
MLLAVPKHWYSWDFDLRDGDRTVAFIDTSVWKEKGTLTIDGAEYRVYREHLMSGAFLLEQHGSALARAEKPSALRRRFLVQFDGRTLELRRTSAFGRRFQLLDGDRELGTITPTTPFTRSARVDLPAGVPLPVRVFIVWLTVLIWKRDASSG